MKKILAVLIILITIVFCIGCGEAESKQEPYFAVVSNGNYNGYLYVVVYDKETKVMYGYGRGSFGVLVNADGTPKLYK